MKFVHHFVEAFAVHRIITSPEMAMFRHIILVKQPDGTYQVTTARDIPENETSEKLKPLFKQILLMYVQEEEHQVEKYLNIYFEELISQIVAEIATSLTVSGEWKEVQKPKRNEYGNFAKDPNKNYIKIIGDISSEEIFANWTEFIPFVQSVTIIK